MPKNWFKDSLVNIYKNELIFERNYKYLDIAPKEITVTVYYYILPNGKHMEVGKWEKGKGTYYKTL